VIGRLALLVLLSGCALFPLTEADCRPASWQQRGYDEWQRLMGSVDFN
jgi:hypothetical protein